MIEQKYRDQIKQGHRRDTGVVDEELLVNKRNKKIFKSVAYAMGLGIGFMILIPILPSIGDEAKQDAMEYIYFVLSYSMIAYSFSLALGFFFLRPYVGLVSFMLNWVIMPGVGLWAVMAGYKVIAG